VARKISIFFARLKYLFNFRKPTFLHLEFIDILADGKLIFLVAWKIKNAHKVSISPNYKTYRRRISSVILTLPEETDIVKLSIASFWRTSRQTIYLKKLPVDKKTFLFLLHQLSPLDAIDCLSPSISLKRSNSYVRQLKSQVYIPGIHCPIQPYLNSQKLEFYEP